MHSGPATSSDVPAYSCTLSAGILARVRKVAGELGVHEALRRAATTRSLEYLQDLSNWISFDEAIALWDAGEAVTRDSHFARHVGEDASRMLAATATAAAIRALGSTEENLRNLNVSSRRWSTSSLVETVEVRPGYCEFRATAAPGFIRSRHHCEWTIGLASQSPVLFGLAPATVDHTQCEVLGAPYCRYVLTWDPTPGTTDDEGPMASLREQLAAATSRLDGVFAAAADLIASGDLHETLARIGERAAEQVRAPAYLLAVRLDRHSDPVCHQRGLEAAIAETAVDRLLDTDDHPGHWCVADVRSHRRDYGRLAAIYPEGSGFLPQERALLDLYARYAATALDSAAALVAARRGRDEARQRDREARALLKLARVLASAGTTEQIAQRLADAAPDVIDCDRVSVWLWNADPGELRRAAVNSTGCDDDDLGPVVSRPEDVPQLASWLEHPNPEPYFINMRDSAILGGLRAVGAVASVAVPIATADRLLGTVQVSVRERPERLGPTTELIDRLAGLAAHAVIALENGRLVDQITHEAQHDQLTGLGNRLALRERVGAAAATAAAAAGGEGADTQSTLALFFVDLDWFKPVNDEFGHEVGDALLCAVADRLQSNVRPQDLVARTGGDEFAVLVSADSEPSLDDIAQRIQRTFDVPFEVAGHLFSVEASIGHAACRCEDADLDRLLSDADAVMYEAKRAQRHAR
jgi:diguanylate cyclase (GGDEF)-like protein